MLTLVATHQLLGHTGYLDVAEGLELTHLLRSDGVLPHGGVHRRAEEQGLSAVPGPDDTGLWGWGGGCLPLCLPALPVPTHQPLGHNRPRCWDNWGLLSTGSCVRSLRGWDTSLLPSPPPHGLWHRGPEGAATSKQTSPPTWVGLPASKHKASPQPATPHRQKQPGSRRPALQSPTKLRPRQLSR